MHRSWTVPVSALVSLTAIACSEPGPTAPAEPSLAATGAVFEASANAIEYAVFGDVPYGASATDRFPELIRAINRDPGIQRAVHLGDIKSGSTVCSDEWFAFVLESFGTFKDPLVYTPGDNEWTDCHRANNGNWNPVERLAKIREVFFSTPGRTLGGRAKRVEAQAGYPENTLWMESGVVFAAIHVVGSNNDRAPWTCYLPFDADCPSANAPESPAMTAEREAEADGRDAANRAWLAHVFDVAEERGAAGVVLFSHGDMWHPEDIEDGVDFSGHQLYVELLAERAAAFERPVILFAGDSHEFRVDHPLIGDTNYGAPDAPNLTQITVDETIESDGIAWLRLRIDPRAPGVFSWEEVITP